MKLKNVITASFVFLALYAIVVLFVNIQLAFLLFSLSPIPVLYLVWSVLKDPTEPKTTFEEHFYQDEKQ